MPNSSKIAVAAKAIDGTETIRSLSNRHSITKRSVWRLANKLKYQRAMHGCNGRPPTFDEASMSVLRATCAAEVKPTRDDLEAEFFIQQRKTWCRLHHRSFENLEEHEGPKPLSKRTMRKYFKELNFRT